jgi:uncharacterized protein YneF (UPF0154 family)
MSNEMSIVVVILVAAVALLFLAVAGCYIGQQRRGKDIESRRGPHDG